MSLKRDPEQVTNRILIPLPNQIPLSFQGRIIFRLGFSSMAPTEFLFPGHIANLLEFA